MDTFDRNWRGLQLETLVDLSLTIGGVLSEEELVEELPARELDTAAAFLEFLRERRRLPRARAKDADTEPVALADLTDRILADLGLSPGFWAVHPGAGKKQNVWPPWVRPSRG